jgi:hypothetical protein
MLGEDGTIIYHARNAETGEPVLVVIGMDDETLSSFSQALFSISVKRDELMDEPVEPDFTPADRDFQAILDSLKNGTKH